MASAACLRFSPVLDLYASMDWSNVKYEDDDAGEGAASEAAGAEADPVCAAASPAEKLNAKNMRQEMRP